MSRWIKENGLLIANLAVFAAFFVGMIICGVQVHKTDQAYARRRYRRHPRAHDAASRGTSRHPFIVTDHDVGLLRHEVKPSVSWATSLLRRHVVESWPARWWVKERQEWWGRVRDADGRQRWIRAVDLRPASGSQR